MNKLHFSMLLVVAVNVSLYGSIFDDFKKTVEKVAGNNPSSQSGFDNNVNLCNAGNAYYCGLVGDAYSNGDDTRENLKEIKSSNGSNSVEKDITKADEYYMKACNLGDRFSCEKTSAAKAAKAEAEQRRIAARTAAKAEAEQRRIAEQAEAEKKRVADQAEQERIYNEKLENGLIIPEFHSLTEKEEWFKKQHASIMKLNNQIVEKLKRLGNDQLVTEKDTKDSIDKKFQNAEELFNRMDSDINEILELYGIYKEKSNVVGFPENNDLLKLNDFHFCLFSKSLGHSGEIELIVNSKTKEQIENKASMITSICRIDKDDYYNIFLLDNYKKYLEDEFTEYDIREKEKVAEAKLQAESQQQQKIDALKSQQYKQQLINQQKIQQRNLKSKYSN